jgi:hypothetical protein
MEDKVGVPTIHRKTSAIMADYLKGGITFAEAGTELDALVATMQESKQNSVDNPPGNKL